MKKGRVSRRRFLAGLGLGAAVPSFASTLVVGSSRRARAAPITLRLSTSFINDPHFSAATVWFDQFQKELKKNSDGQIVVQFFPNSQLGKEADVIGQVKLGIIDMMIGGSAIWATVVPEIGILDLGYVFDSFDHFGRAADGEAGNALAKMMSDRAGIHILGWGYSLGARNFLTKRAAQTPDGLAGMKIRALPAPAVVETVRLMGAIATPMAFGEVYVALQTGVIDGVEHDAPTILSTKFYETAKFITLTQHTFQSIPPILSNRSFERIPANLREGFLAAAQNATTYQRSRALAIEAEAFENLRKLGVSVLGCDRSAFRQRVRPLWDDFIGKHPSAKSILEAITKAHG